MPTKTSFIIRPAVEAEVTSILACLAETFAPYRDCYSAEAFLDTVLSAETLKHRMNHMKVLVAVGRNNDDIIGIVACNMVSPQEGHLRGMAVLEAWQGTGVAQQLLERAETELRLQGCTRVTLDTTEPLKRAMCFYERNGFRPSGQVTDFFGMPLYEYVKSLS